MSNKTTEIIAVICACAAIAWGQVASFAQETPSSSPSNIDLLRRSFSSSSVAGIASSTKVNPEKASTPKENSSQNISQTSTIDSTGTVKAPPSSSKNVAPITARPVTGTVRPAEVETDLDQHNALMEQGAQKTSVAPNTKQSVQGKAAQTEPTKQLPHSQGKSTPAAVASVSKKQSTKTAAAEPAYDPLAARTSEKVKWKRSDSKHFIIYTQTGGQKIGSANLDMLFESAYDMLQLNISWMTVDKVSVFVYQDKDSFLANETQAQDWMLALAYPAVKVIAVYDVPSRLNRDGRKALKTAFAHELVHVFTQQFFANKKQTSTLMAPLWLDEGLAVYIEDQTYNNTEGGPWAHDLRTYNIRRSRKKNSNNFEVVPTFGSFNHFAGPRPANRRVKTVKFLPFDEFMKENSLEQMSAKGKAQEWYLQAYAMVRFLLSPQSGFGLSNTVQFRNFTELIAQGELLRDPKSGLPIYDKQGRKKYRAYSVEEALSTAYHYTPKTMEDAFWRWAKNLPKNK